MKKTLLAAILLMGCGQISQPSILTQAPEPTVVPGLPGVSSRGLLQARRDAAGLGSQSQGVVSGDFNRDGLLDMVVPSFDDNLVNLFLNRGEGFFHPAQTRVLEGDGLWAVASGDLNGDGNLDLVFTQLQSDRVVALLGDGRGGFASPVFTDAPGFPTGVSLADFTGDSRPDAAVSLLNSGQVILLPNGGGGSFQTPIPLTVGSQPMSVISADFNADGKADPLAGRPGSSVVTLVLSQGSGHAPGVDYAGGSTSPVAADLNGDGSPDLAGLSSDQLLVRLNQGRGLLGSAIRTALPENCAHLTSADLNHDGRGDLLASGQNTNQLYPVLGNGQGGFVLGRPRLSLTGTQGLLSRDFSGDGKEDAAMVVSTASLTLGLLLGKGDGSWWSTIASPPQFAVDPLVSADFNGDGRLDLAMGGFRNDLLGIALGRGDGTFQPPETFAMGEPVTSVSQGDLNGDGRPDLVSAQQRQGTVAVTLSRPGGFAPPEFYDVDGPARQAVCADLNGDGRLDVVSLSDDRAEPALALLFNQGEGRLRPGGLVLLPDSPRCLAAGDLDGQGLTDLVVGSGGRLQVLINRGSGQFKDPLEVSIGQEILALELADFDQDGRLDVAALNQNAPNHTVEVLRNQGGGQLQPWREVALPGQPASRFSLTDLNGDSWPDLVVPFPARQAVVVFLSRSLGVFQEPLLYGGDGVFADVASGDFDGDGRLDVAGGDTSGAGLRVLLAMPSP